MSSLTNRIDFLLGMIAKRPDDSRARFGLAVEYEKLGDNEQVVTHLSEYLRLTDDEGNGYARLARALRALGRGDEAAAAYRHGIDNAERHGHPSLAAELEEELDGL